MLRLVLAFTFTYGMAAHSPAEPRLDQVQTWMYQLQELYEPEAWATLAESEYDMLVVEPGQNFSEWPYDTAAMVQTLRYKPDGSRRALLAYVDIGQAEDYRDYWDEDWKAPEKGFRGEPDFLVSLDPDGWSGNYPVAYWDARWQALWLGRSGTVAQLAELGFDGIYLDWVEAYDDEAVIQAALEDGVAPAAEMITFVERLGDAGRAVNPQFLVVAQNAIYLIHSAPKRYLAAIDALAVEDTWFHGYGDSDWDDPDGGDQRDRHDDDYATDARLRQIAKYRAAGLPVFSVDYALKPRNVAQVYAEAPRHGLVPLVTRVALSRLTETPPPRLGQAQ
jgi:cysteinyl-tRNA synthetase, unknown class